MQTLICQFVMISVLFLSVDGAFDRVSEGHPHGDGTTGELGPNVCTDPGATSDEHNDLDPDHCEHCCHGHATSVAMEAQHPVTYPAAGAQVADAPSLFTKGNRAPPTPPPNA